MLMIDGNQLTIDQVLEVSIKNRKVKLAETAIDKIQKSRQLVEDILKQRRAVYGITTGFGELANHFISPEESEQLQVNLIRSHAVGVGECFCREVVRSIILLRANALAKGYSGVRPALINKLLEFLNKDVYPFIPSQGSVGASGDLAPLAHLALAVIGEGECLENGNRVPTQQILDKKNISPLTLLAKEGLAMINGTQMMAGIGCLVVNEAQLLLKNAQIAGALSLEALKGTAKAFDAKIHQLRAFPGQQICAENIRRMVENSEIIESHKNCEKVQDAYTLRCMPQVYGAIRDTIDHAAKTLTIEINSVTDNPLVFAEQGEVISGGNFHGEPLALVMDFLAIALAEIASISERTVDRMVNPHVSGLPPFLIKNSGINSGLMIAQYTAAALVSENKILAHPASVDSIPTSAGQEDHVSMGSISARKAWQVLRNVENVLAIEMICAAQGVEFHPQKPGKGTAAAWETIRKHVEFIKADRVIYPDIEKVRKLIVDGVIVQAVEKAIGELN